MDKNKGLSLKTTGALIAIIFLLGIGTTTFFFGVYKMALVQTFDIKINIEDANVIGFSVDPYLDFGTIPAAGGVSKRTINLHNPFEFPVEVRILMKGDATRFMRLEDNNFILDPDEGRQLPAYAVVPDKFGLNVTLSGKAKVIYVRV